MQLQQASRRKAKIKLCLQSPSGGCKTYSALLIAYGLCNDWSKIAIIDTENKSADLYDHLGKYYVLPLTAPYTPERYIDAVQTCLQAGIQVVIIDSLSHEWEGTGGVLETHGNMAGNSFTNWAKITPRHNAFVQYLLQSDIHIIATIRSKQDYVLAEKNGKQVPEKVGLRGIQREGLDYEFTLVLELNMKHMAVATKDRTGLFMDKPEFLPTASTGRLIAQWCNHGIDNNPEEVRKQIQSCNSNEELLALYNLHPRFQGLLLSDFTKRRQELLNNIAQPQKQQRNGSYPP